MSKMTTYMFTLLIVVIMFPLRMHAQDQELVWPSPPDSARIRYLSSITSEKDIEGEPSFLKKVWNFIVGADKITHVLAQPVGVAVGPDGVLYVADPAARCVHVIDIEDEDYERISHAYSGALESPVGIVWANDELFFVSDSERRIVAAYDEDGDPLFTISDYFGRPTGLAVLDGKLYVVDTGMHKVLVFDLEGHILREFGSRGSEAGAFNFPVYITGDDDLYIVDALNFRVQVLRKDGTPVRHFGTQGSQAGKFAHPKGIALDSDGNVYVVDALFDAFQVFDQAGRLLLIVGGSGAGPGSFSNPAGICIDNANRIYVADALNHRIQVFQYLGKQ
jgi:DNA-binding beta-propeller fold protein YncE